MRQAVSIARSDVGWVSASVTHHSRRQGSRLITGTRSEETSCACRIGGLRAVALTHPTLTVTPLTQPEGCKPSEIQIEIQNVIDARCKLQNLIAGLNKQQAEAELAFLRGFSRDLAALKVDFDRPFVERTFTEYTSVKQTGDQITQRITALSEIATKIEKRINEFKKANREDLRLVLEGKLERLKAERAVQGKETDLLDKEIGQLEGEISQLEGTGQKQAPQYQAETAPQPPKVKA